MKISIIGTGGVGGYFGGKLAKAGNEVTFLARGKHLQAIQEKGLFVKSIQGDFEVSPINATEYISEMGVPELVVVSVKAWQVKDIAQELVKAIGKDTVVLPLQNGILSVEELKEYINPANVIGGLCRIISKIESPGVINHMGVDPVIIFGELDNTKTARIQKLKEVFTKSGINSKIAEDIQAELWKKLISICAGGILAISRSTYGEIRELEPTRKMAIGLLNEIYRLTQKIGINIEPDYVEKVISIIDRFPYDASSSLARDVWEGKPTEIEYQNGTVVKLGQQYNVATPINEFIYNCILPMEIRSRKNK